MLITILFNYDTNELKMPRGLIELKCYGKGSLDSVNWSRLVFRTLPVYVGYDTTGLNYY